MYLLIAFGTALVLVTIFTIFVRPLTPFAFMMSMIGAAVVIVVALLVLDMYANGVAS